MMQTKLQDEEREATDLLLIHAKPIIEELLNANKPELDWRMAEYLCNDQVIHLLLCYISRLPSDITLQQIHQIYMNLNRDMEWIHHTLNKHPSNGTINPHKRIHIDKDRDRADHDRHFLLKSEKNMISNIYTHTEESEEESEEEPDIDYFEKMSFSLMKILCNSYAPAQVKSFLLRKIDFIVFHALLVFHPLSFGNIYHSSEILNILLFYWPLQLFQVLTTSKCIAIQYLLKYAITSRTHQWKFGDFIIHLICYHNNSGNDVLQQNINKYKKRFIDQMLVQWKFIENTIEIATNPVIYGYEIANKYCLFITNLLKKCAVMPETMDLFTAPHNMLCALMDRLLNNVLDKSSDAHASNKWHKINCAMILKDIIHYLSKKAVVTVIHVPKSQAMVAPIESVNCLYPLFESALNTFAAYIPLIIHQITEGVPDTWDAMKGNRSQKIGLIKVNCFELLMLYVDVIKIQNENFVIPDMNRLCRLLLNMVFMHSHNNVFLNTFMAFMKVLSTYCVDDLKYVVVECKMVHRFMEYYNDSEVVHCALHAYIAQMLYDIYVYHDELKEIEDQEMQMMEDEDVEEEWKREREWNFASYLEAEPNQNLIQFVHAIQEDVDLHEPDDDI